MNLAHSKDIFIEQVLFLAFFSKLLKITIFRVNPALSSATDIFCTILSLTGKIKDPANMETSLLLFGNVSHYLPRLGFNLALYLQTETVGTIRNF